MASGGSYHINEKGERELKQRSGHAQPEPRPEPKKVETNEDKKKSAAGRG